MVPQQSVTCLLLFSYTSTCFVVVVVVQEYKDIYLPVTLKSAQEFVSLSQHVHINLSLPIDM